MQIIKPLSGPKFLGAVFVRNVECISKQLCQFFVFTFLSLQFKFSVHPCILFCLLAFPPHPFPYFLISGYLLRNPDNSNFFFDFPRRFELSPGSYLPCTQTSLSLDENVRAKECGKESVLFQWSLAAHHQSLAITLRKTKCLRRRKGSYDQHQNRKNSGYFSRKSPQALASKPLKLEIHTSSGSVTKKF